MHMFKRLSSRVTALAVGFALVLIVIAGNIWFNVSQQQGSELVQHTMEVESQLYRLLSFLEDAETGQRGYLLTGDEGFLAPYLSATAALDGQFKSLAALIADPGQRQALSTLTNLAKERLARLKEIIDRYRVGERDHALAMVRNGASKAVMDQAVSRRWSPMKPTS
jgi:adenylate cyclase